MRTCGFMLAMLAALPVPAQFSYPASASIGMAFVQLADGGPVADRWSTTIIFTNPNTTTAVSLRVSFYGNTGQPLLLDFGQGASATLLLNLPAGGTQSVTSTGTSSTTTISQGWGIAIAELPVTGVVLYRSSANGVAGGDVAAIGAGPTYFYTSYATERLGVALVNPSENDRLRVRVRAVDENGVDKGFYDADLPPNGHESFVLYSKIPGLMPKFTGSITVTPNDDPPMPFAAWTLNSRNDFLSTLPPGEMLWPGPYVRRYLDVAYIARLAGAALIYETDPYLDGTDPDRIAEYIRGIGFEVDPDTSLKAYYNPADNDVHLSTGLLEALGASDAAVAFVISHMAAHGVLSHTGMPDDGPFVNDPELLADSMADATLVKAGFDPSGAAEFYGRLFYAHQQGLTIDPALRAEFAIPNGVPGRLQKLWTIIQGGCTATGDLVDTCAKARKYWHPSNPVSIP